eukprot:1375190-Amorphochlora_amoeboformis.AAC.1
MAGGCNETDEVEQVGKKVVLDYLIVGDGGLAAQVGDVLVEDGEGLQSVGLGRELHTGGLGVCVRYFSILYEPNWLTAPMGERNL